MHPNPKHLHAPKDFLDAARSSPGGTSINAYPDNYVPVPPGGYKQPPGSIARTLLSQTGGLTYRNLKAGESVSRYAYDETRPLIDTIQEGSLRGAAGLSRVADPYAFRAMLRKAKCFTLDAASSALIGDLSIAVAHDIDTARKLALPPFPVTWFEIDNVARLNRMAEHGFKLTPVAQGVTDQGPPVDKVGWLIEPTPQDGGYCLTYFALLDEGPVAAPLSWCWRIDDKAFMAPPEYLDPMMERLAFGMKNSNAVPGTFTMAFGPSMINRRQLHETEQTAMEELGGELRHLFGLLVAVSAGGAGLTMSSSPKARHEGPARIQPNGKPLLPLEHHHLHLHLQKRKNLDHVVRQILTHHKKRFHDVRAHMRKLKSGRMVPVKSHGRGDKTLGVVTKDYVIEK